MKARLGTVSLLSLLLTATVAFGQGGLGRIGHNLSPNEDFEAAIPLTMTIGGGGGWDSNMNTSAIDRQESWYINGGIGAVYGMVNGRTTRLDLGGNYGVSHYFDPGPFTKETYHNGRGTLNFSHRFSPRTALTNNFYLAYENEPDFMIGASAARRNDQYFYGYNNLALSHSWSRRLSTVTGYTLTGIHYDKSVVGTTENRLTHILSHQFRHMLDRQTTLTATYRYMHTSYRDFDRNVDNHFALGGVDHIFSPYLNGTISVGAQFRNDNVSGSNTAPYLEAALDYRADEDTTFRWAHSLGYENNEIAGFSNRYSYRTGLTWTERWTPYISSNVGASFVYSDFKGGEIPGIDENVISVSASLSFRILDNTDLTAGYYFTNYSSDNPLRDYNRHRVSLGVSATF